MHQPSASTTLLPPRRTARPRRFLMCAPTHYDVNYSINPWMHPDKPTNTELALTQWEQLRGLLRDLGHEVLEISPVPGLPDMVFAANGATMIDGRVLSARFRYPQRVPEGPAYLAWFQHHGFTVRDAVHINEGEGDLLFTGERVLAGTGFRTHPDSHAEAAEFFGREVVTLHLVNSEFYHLDTALSVLDHDEVMYYPEAFSAESRQVLRDLYPDAILANQEDAAVFGLNSVSDGRHVLLAPQAVHLHQELADRGFVPIGIDLSELLKAGGSAKCCTLEIREASAC
ncbi:N-dimethylarginine dimethylaminohydrolase [Streptacidiphilus sp. EB129]